MSAETAVYALLTGAGAVTSIAGTRIYPGVLPEGQPVPAVVFEHISAMRPGAIDAYAPTHLTRTRLQFNLLAADYATVKALRDAVRNALQFARGSLGGSTVHSVLYAGEGPDLFDQGLAVFSQSIDFLITHEA